MEISKLKELREKMLHEKSGFDFENYRIVTDTYKGIVAAFGVYLYSKEDARDAIIKCATSDYSKQELMAIFAGNILVVTKYSITPDEETDQIMSIEEYSRRFKNKVAEVVKDCYDKATPTKMDYDVLPEESKRNLRRELIEFKYEEKNNNISEYHVTRRDILEDLLGKRCIVSEICNEFNETGDIEQIYLLWHKQHDDLLRDAIKADNFLTEDDDRLLTALYGITGKTVNVSFEKNGVVSPFAKFDRENLLRIIKTEYDISSYNFSNGKEGEKIIKMLGITWQNGLYHTNIKEVMFGGKVIYSK